MNSHTETKGALDLEVGTCPGDTVAAGQSPADAPIVDLEERQGGLYGCADDGMGWMRWPQTGSGRPARPGKPGSQRITLVRYASPVSDGGFGRRGTGSCGSSGGRST